MNDKDWNIYERCYNDAYLSRKNDKYGYLKKWLDEDERKKGYPEKFFDVMRDSYDTYTSNDYLWEDKPKKNDDGMYRLNVDLQELLEEWMDEVEFKVHHLTLADTILIKNYIREGKYNDNDKIFLQEVRTKWINYLKKKNGIQG